MSRCYEIAKILKHHIFHVHFVLDFDFLNKNEQFHMNRVLLKFDGETVKYSGILRDNKTMDNKLN